MFKLIGNDKIWEPTAKQREFLAIPDNIPEALFGGAASGGKSELAVLFPILREWHKNPNFAGIVFRRTYPEVEASLQKVSLEYFPSLGATYNETKHFWRFPSGATIKLGYSEKVSDIRKHDSAEYQYIAFDEATHFEPTQYLYMLSRNRTTNATLPAIMRSYTNPGGIGHSFFRDRFVTPFPLGNRILRFPDGSSRIYIHATVYDNPHIQNREQYILNLQQLPEADRKAKLEGDWFSFEGQVFSEFRAERSILANEPENALHVCEPFDIPTYWPVILSVDWGYTAKVVAYWSAVSPDGRVYIFYEYTAQKMSIRQWASDVGRLTSLLAKNLSCAVLDPSAWKEEGHEKTIAQQVIDASGINFEKADNARVSGKQNMHDFLRWIPRPPKYLPKTGYDEARYWSIYRMQGQDKADAYMSMFAPEPEETNLPRLQIFKDKCPELIRAIQLCTYDDNRKEDVKAFDGDDPYDSARYNLMAVERYIRECAYEHKKVAKLESILNARDKSLDQTNYYLQMAQFDREFGTGTGQPVSRYSPRFGRRVILH